MYKEQTGETRKHLMRAAICQLLEWTEEAYGQFQENCGYCYLQHYLPFTDPAVMYGQWALKVYWDWWHCHWQARDAVFTSHLPQLQRIGRAGRIAIYEALHDTAILSESLWPNSVVLTALYTETAGSVNQ